MTGDPGHVDIARLRKEQEELHEGILNCVLSWSGLENGLALLLHQLIDRGESSHIGLALYFAPSNTETRIKLVDAAFKHTAFPGCHDEKLFRQCFTKILLRIDKSKSSRNKIVHGDVVSMHVGDSHHVRLTGAIFDVGRREPFVPGRVPGLASDQVKQIVLAIQDRTSEIRRVRELIGDYIGSIVQVTQGTQNSDDPTWQREASREKLLQLAEDLKIGSHRKSDHADR